MDYESSDILGSDSFPVRNPSPAKWSGFSKTAFFLALLLAAYIGGVRGWDALLKWREKAYRLSMRRRHGIPDNDHRPFNVAYAAVLRARREEEVANNRVHRVDVDELYAQADRHAAPVESNIRQRNNQYRNSEPSWPNGPINGLPGRFNPLAVDSSRFASSSSTIPLSSSHPTNFAERYNPNPPPPAPPVVRFADEIEDADLPRRGSIPNLHSSPRKHQKRALEEYEVESDVPENPKKTRVEGDEFIDGDEDAEWLPRQKRGEKRVMHDDEEDASPPGRRVRGKRARKVSLEEPDVFMNSDDNLDDMDVDEEDEWREAPPIARGKKRDAGSSFGEGAEGEDQEQKTKRKRRTRKSDAATAQLPSRGQKRDRDGDEEGSDAEAVVPGTPLPTSRKTKKRGKKSKEAREDDEEGSVDGSVSKGKGRPIGDQWESNGVLYKIGPNGQRLRQALVKKAARRFTMPLDSQHPDKNANLEVCIETWLTEEEYNDFKSRHLLAWQDSPKGTQEPESVPSTPAVAEPPSTPTPNPVAKGKNLLWDSPASPFPVFAPSPAEKEQQRPKAHFRQSIAADLGVRVNPFDKANALHVGAEIAKNGLRGNGRRIVAARETLANPGLPGLADSTNSIAQAPLARRTFSKWEKQDLEAKAMMKMREANQAKVKEKELKERLEKEKREREAAAAAAAAAPIPTISLSKPSAEPAKPPAISFAPPAPSAAPPTTSSTQAPPFSLGLTPTPATPSKVSFGPPATSDKPQQSAPIPFAPPASAGPAASSVPNPFGKPPSSSQPTPHANSNLFAPPPSSAAGAPSNTTTPSFSFPSAPPAGGTKTPAFASAADRPIAGAPTRKPSESPFAPGTTTTKPSFSFAPPAQKQNPPLSGEQSAGSQVQQSEQSLLSRMGGASKPAEAAASAPPTFSFKPTDQSALRSAFTAPQPPAGNSAGFSFKPAEAKAPSTFAPVPQPTVVQEAPAAAPPAPKFNFAFAAAKPAATSSSATPSSLTGALGSSEPQPAAAPVFSFKPADKPTTTPAGTPSLSFGPSAGQSSAFASPSPAPAAGEGEQKKSAFGSNFAFGGAAAGVMSSSPSPFGSNNAQSAFGGGAGKSAFGGGGAFGSLATKPAEEAPKAAPAAGTSAQAPTPAAPAPAFNFAFGGNTNASTTPAASPAFAAKPSPFGGPSIFGKSNEATTTPQGSPFGAGAPSAFKPTTGSVFGGSATSTPSPFGAPKTDAATPAAPAVPSPFGAPAPSSIFGNSATAGPSAFGFGANPQK